MKFQVWTHGKTAQTTASDHHTTIEHPGRYAVSIDSQGATELVDAHQQEAPNKKVARWKSLQWMSAKVQRHGISGKKLASKLEARMRKSHTSALNATREKRGAIVDIQGNENADHATIGQSDNVVASMDSQNGSLSLSQGESGSVEPAVTVVIMDYSRMRWQSLCEVLKRYRAYSPGLIAEVVVVWNDAADLEAPRELVKQTTSASSIPLRVITMSRNSMNNRFAVWSNITTQGVMIQDNDLTIDERSLSCIIEAWRSNPSRLVGAWSQRRHFSFGPSGMEYVNRPGQEFSILLPRPLVVDRKYMRLYMKNLPMLAMIDDTVNCDDIYMNAVVAKYSKQPPIAVDVSVSNLASAFHNGLSNQAGWYGPNGTRSECLKKVQHFFTGAEASATSHVVFQAGKGSMKCGLEKAVSERSA